MDRHEGQPEKWAADRRGLERFRTEQPAYSILSRGIEREVLPIAERYGLGILVWGPLAQGMAFATAHPGVTSAIIGPHTMHQLDDLLAGAEVTLTGEILDRIDEIVPPGTDVGTLDQAYSPPAMLNPSLRRRRTAP